ncbi:Uma2 family endonuclease [Sorangium sp. So ce385]|uniref:Uma2 family endonuclease n=1 Tax=Sorangium sp. So ce385 TaxID=3133308 RepID=UPI003F5B2564
MLRSKLVPPVRTGANPHATRLPRALVVRDPEPEELRATIDWSDWYLDDADGIGAWGEHDEIARLLLSSIAQLARERGWTDHHAGSDRFFAWVREEPLVRVSPDVYLLDHRPAPPLPKQWQTWLPGHRPPRFALEIVASDWQKAYEDIPLKYCQLGCPELAIFDPLAAAQRPPAGRVALQAYRRDPDGAYVRVHAGAGPAWSPALDSWLCVVGSGADARLRLARPGGKGELVPTQEEVAATEARAREAAEARVRELEARVRELEQLEPR